MALSVYHACMETAQRPVWSSVSYVKRGATDAGSGASYPSTSRFHTGETFYTIAGLLSDKPTDTPNGAEPEVVPSRTRRFPRVGKRLIIVALLVVVILATITTAAFATYNYSKEYEGRILPGSTIAGVDVGGLTRQAALAEVRRAVRPELYRTITVRWKGRNWQVTPHRLGARSDARAVVDDALAASSRASFLKKVGMKFFGDVLGFERDVDIRYRPVRSRRFIERVAARVERKPQDAYIDHSSGWIRIIPDKIGRNVRQRAAFKRLMSAQQDGSSRVFLPVKNVKPDVTTEAFNQVLLLRIGENRLYLYQNRRITHSWTVATGMPEYPTPTGFYEVVRKEEWPTWINPDPEGWGKDMPAQIPPGPSNPLGVRALAWSAPAVLFHGTTATYSLGYNASHGCVRLSNSDVIELYGLVDVGTPIVSTVVAPFKPLYSPVTTPDALVTPSENDKGGKEKKG